MKNKTAAVVYLGYDGLTDPLGQSQILPYVGALSKIGFTMTVVSFEKRMRFRNEEHLINGWCQACRVRWVPLEYHKWPPILSTIFDLLRLWRTVSQLYNEEPFQVVHCRSYLVSLIGLWAKRRKHVKFLFDMRGFWADERVEGGLWDLRNPIYRLVYHFFKKQEMVFLEHADYVISLTDNARRELLRWGVKAPITVIPTCVDTELFQPDRIQAADREALRARLGIRPDNLVCLYLGSWGTWYETDQMLALFSVLKERSRSAVFLIVTQDEVQITDFPHADSVLVTRASRAQVPLFISLARFALCFVKPSFSKKASSATKMGEIMAMNVPVVVNRGWGDVNTLVPESLLVDEFSEAEFHRLLNHLLKQESGSYQLTQGVVSLEQGVKRYERIYRALSIEPDTQSKTA